MIAWLAQEVCPSELNEDRQREAVLARCRAERIEPPGRMSRIIGSANRIADERFCATIVGRLSADVAQSLWALIVDGDDESGFLAELKADPGKLGLETLLAEITKLQQIRAIALPADLFTDIAERRIARWRERCVGVFPSTLRRDHSPPVMLTLLTVLSWCRLTEVTDSLVELFVDLVRAINTRRVGKAQLAEFRRVANKENVLYTVAGVSVAHPDGRIREVVYPAVGEQTLKDLVAEAKATESRRRTQVRTVLVSSYSHHYRTMLPKLLEALEVRCNNTGDGRRRPVDCDLHRDVHYEAIAQPIDPTEFVASLRTRVDTSLARWAQAMQDGTAGTRIGTRKGQVWISVSKPTRSRCRSTWTRSRTPSPAGGAWSACSTCSRRPTG